MEILLTKIAAALVLPPGVNIVLGIIGLALWRRMRVLALLLCALSFGGLLVLSMPTVGNALIADLERFPARAPGAVVPANAGAIVVLGGGRYAGAPEYGGDTLSHAALERVRYAARLHKETGLPLAVSGGVVLDEGAVPEAALMRDVLVGEFGVPVRWVEDASRNTQENADNVTRLLGAEGITSALVVTHALHMPRALEAFERAGMIVYAAPTGFDGTTRGRGIFDWLPSIGGLEDSTRALHERLGQVWYRLRY
ncbi:MAG: YdcF family protein [Gammaproteobacteria bacterium]|nr:YdcF family protein [Gammaproteobacteria bacterium]